MTTANANTTGRWLVVAVVCGLSACSGKRRTTAAPDAAPVQAVAPLNLPVPARVPVAVPADLDAGVPAEAPAPADPLADCPCAASGAKTTLAAKDGKITLEVTGTDAAAARDLLARAERLLAASFDRTLPAGPCPVVLERTRLRYDRIDGGVRLVLTPERASDFSWLERAVTDRLAALTAPAVATGADAGTSAAAVDLAPPAATPPPSYDPGDPGPPPRDFPSGRVSPNRFRPGIDSDPPRGDIELGPRR